MRIAASIALLFFVMLCTAAKAADLVGTWQAEDKNRHVLEITTARGHLQARLYSLGQEQGFWWRNGDTISQVNIAENAISFHLDRNPGIFSGTLGKDGQSFSGTWRTFGLTTPLTFRRASKGTAWPLDLSPHKVHFVAVNKDVRLEVLDWGGSGPPLIFLAGMGSTAHVFDDFAPKFTGKHHVYAITRRGFGMSSAPPPTFENYDSDLLGDDVLAVMRQLGIKRPVLAGHSVAGEELSSIGTRYPEEVAGLIYLEAGYSFAVFDPDSAGGVFENSHELIRNLKTLSSGNPQDIPAAISRIQAILPHLQKGLKETSAYFADVKPQPSVPRPPQFDILDAISFGMRPYSKINAPILALFAIPRKCAPHCDTPAIKAAVTRAAHQADVFKAANPEANIVRLPFASHRLFISNEAEVEQRMNNFMDTLH